MTNIVRSKSKISRRLGVNIWGRENDAFLSKAYPPGQHGASGYRGFASDFSKQMTMYRKFKAYYGLTGATIRRIFRDAVAHKGLVADNLVSSLESRLLTVLFRSGLVKGSISAVRQIISHGHICVDGKRVNVGGYSLKPGQKVTIALPTHQNVVAAKAKWQSHLLPFHIAVDIDRLEITFVKVPVFADDILPQFLDISKLIEYLK